MATFRSVELDEDDDGDFWVVERRFVRSRRDVPVELIDEYDELIDERARCAGETRDAAEDAYRRALGDPSTWRR